MQGPKKRKGWEIDQINWKLIHKWAMNEQNAQAQKKLYDKIRSMPSKSSAATYSAVLSVHKMWYSRIWVLKAHSQVWDNFWQLKVLEKWWKMLSFYFTLQALFVLKIFNFLSWHFGHVAKRLDFKDKVNFNILWRHRLVNKQL